MTMNLKLSVHALISIVLLGFISSSPIPASAAGVFYVVEGGYDGYDCESPGTACGTIDGALAKAAPGDTIKVTAETFGGFGQEVVYVNKDIVLSGGWDQAFSNQTGRTIVDAQDLRQGIEIVQSANAYIENFIIQNGYSYSSSGGIANWGTLAIDNSIVQNNTGPESAGGGISNYGTLTVVHSTIRNNISHGIYNWDNAGPLTILDSTINNNTGGAAIWIFNQSATMVNSTISDNLNPGFSYDGGGIYYGGSGDSSLLLKNVTITGNKSANSGGGIFISDLNGGQVLMENSILSGNTATFGQDCVGPITSHGYNIIGDTINCTISSTIGDQLNVDPEIAPLRYNGGPTYTHRLYAGSPAIDGGNPAGCPDQLGNPLSTDQRGFPRPLDGNGDGNPSCDVGAYEYDPTVIILGSYLPMVIR